MLENSNHLVVAKQGQSKILFKNYVRQFFNEYQLETMLTGIVQILVPHQQKLLMIFDSSHYVISQYSLFNFTAVDGEPLTDEE